MNDEGVWNGLYDRSVGVKPQASGWDWYCLDDPKVARAQASQGRRSVLEQQFRLPGANASLSPEWRRITHPDYKDIQWSYWQMPSLSCNGIKVRGYARSRGEERLGTSGHVGLKRPNVSVFDPDGYLPLVLQRNALATEKYPFQDRLFEDVLRDWLAFILAAAPDSPFLRGQLVEYVSWYAGIIEHWRARHWPGGLTPFCSAAKGVLLADPWHLQQCKFHRLLFLSEAGRASPSVYSCSDLPDLVVVPVGDIGSGLRYRQWIRVVLCGQEDPEFSHLGNLRVTCRRMSLPGDEYLAIKQGGVIAEHLWSKVRVESSNPRCVVVHTGDCNCKGGLDLVKASEYLPGGGAVLAEWHVAAEQPEPSDLTPMAKLWRDLLGDPIIPYAPAERRKKFPDAFRMLKDYIAAHEQLIAKRLQAGNAKKST